MSFTKYGYDIMPILYEKFGEKDFMAWEVGDEEIKRHLRILKNEGLLVIVGKRYHFTHKNKRVRGFVYRVSERYIRRIKEKSKKKK